MQSIFLDPHNILFIVYLKMVDPITFIEYPSKGIAIWDTWNKLLQVN
jgi:hypothetical protein